MITEDINIHQILRWFTFFFLAGQQTCKEAQGCHGNHPPGDDTHGECHGQELRRPEHSACRGSPVNHIYGLT